MFNISPLANLFLVVAFAGLAILVIHTGIHRVKLMRRHGLNPFSPRDALDVLGGAYADPSDTPFLQRGYGKLALALMVGGFFAMMAVVIGEVIFTARG